MCGTGQHDALGDERPRHGDLAMPTYYGNQFMTNFWARPEDPLDQLFQATSSVKDKQGRALVAFIRCGIEMGIGRSC